MNILAIPRPSGDIIEQDYSRPKVFNGIDITNRPDRGRIPVSVQLYDTDVATGVACHHDPAIRSNRDRISLIRGAGTNGNHHRRRSPTAKGAVWYSIKQKPSDPKVITVPTACRKSGHDDFAVCLQCGPVTNIVPRHQRQIRFAAVAKAGIVTSIRKVPPYKKVRSHGPGYPDDKNSIVGQFQDTRHITLANRRFGIPNHLSDAIEQLYFTGLFNCQEITVVDRRDTREVARHNQAELTSVRSHSIDSRFASQQDLAIRLKVNIVNAGTAAKRDTATATE